jgi:hypothetical protein
MVEEAMDNSWKGRTMARARRGLPFCTSRDETPLGWGRRLRAGKARALAARAAAFS